MYRRAREAKTTPPFATEQLRGAGYLRRQDGEVRAGCAILGTSRRGTGTDRALPAGLSVHRFFGSGSGPAALWDYQATSAPWTFVVGSVTQRATLWSPTDDEIVPLA